MESKEFLQTPHNFLGMQVQTEPHHNFGAAKPLAGRIFQRKTGEGLSEAANWALRGANSGRKRPFLRTHAGKAAKVPGECVAGTVESLAESWRETRGDSLQTSRSSPQSCTKTLQRLAQTSFRESRPEAHGVRPAARCALQLAEERRGASRRDLRKARERLE